jgi:hypothetical protein
MKTLKLKPMAHVLSGSGARKPLFYVRRRPNGEFMVGRSNHGTLKTFRGEDAQSRAHAWCMKAYELHASLKPEN